MALYIHGNKHVRPIHSTCFIHCHQEYIIKKEGEYPITIALCNSRTAKVVAQSRVRLIVVGVSIGVAIRIQEPRLTYNGIATATCVASCIMDYTEISNCACANG